ncbi:DUF547 domain-containing protein [Halobacteria archaeon AArc-dxtr1]|nr:DUF547 domain-containing protein [Halobacteria archaeon AArc-dxtr1]
MPTQIDPLSLSGDLLYAVKTDGDIDELRTHLATLDRTRLRRALSGREQRLAFWLNTYNAYAQLLLEANPEIVDAGHLERWLFVIRDRIPVAGVWLSLSDIEHGLLRGSRHPWGLGYLPRPFPSSFEREFRLERVEPQIHFALLQRGEHGPPVTVYSPGDVIEELEIATAWYLEENVVYDRETNIATMPRRFLWYRGDFGGKRGIVSLLRKHDVVPADASPTIEYDEFDWSVDIHDAGVDIRDHE